MQYGTLVGIAFFGTVVWILYAVIFSILHGANGFFGWLTLGICFGLACFHSLYKNY